jgi:hypothetical protein
MWQLIPASLDNSNHHLAHIPLKDTHLSDCSGFCVDMNARFELEDRVCHYIYTLYCFQINSTSIQLNMKNTCSELCRYTFCRILVLISLS